MSLTEALCLSVTNTVKVVIKMPYGNLTGDGKDLHILIVISIGKACIWVISEFPLSIRQLHH